MGIENFRKTPDSDAWALIEAQNKDSEPSDWSREAPAMGEKWRDSDAWALIEAQNKDSEPSHCRRKATTKVRIFNLGTGYWELGDFELVADLGARIEVRSEDGRKRLYPSAAVMIEFRD